MEASNNDSSRREVEKDISFENEMLKTIINNSEAGVYVSDYITCEILFANRRTVEFTGNRISPEELVGKICWQALRHGADGRCEFCAYKRLVGDNGELLAPYTWDHYFPEFGHWARITNQAIRWVDGRIAQITTFHDITETKKIQEMLTEHIRLEEQWKMQQNLRIILDSLPVPIRVVDVETSNITYVNQKFLSVFEFTSEEDIVGRAVKMLVPETSSSGVDYWGKMRTFYHTEGVNDTEIEYLTATGNVFVAKLTNRIIDYNGKKSSVGIITDLTAEREQRRLLVQAAEREREANQLKSSFLSNMSHEIRTPMSAIIGLTDVELRKNPPKDTLAVYKKINESAKNLLQIINDILDLSKIEANKVELFPVEFELEEVLNSALLIAAPRLEGKPVELVLDLSLDLPRFMIGDKTRLWQVLRNLLDNSAKFTAKGSVILTVAEDISQQSDETVSVSFTVTDTGIGMSEEQSVRVFSPYEQIAGADNSQYSGTGLGLPISKQLCELMGGTIGIESRQGYGTVMKFTLPFARAQNAETELEALRQTSMSQLNILIVDDSELTLRSIEHLLQSCGACCYTAEDLGEALRLISDRGTEQHFDIAIIDCISDEKNILKCAKLLRDNLPRTSKILILTSYTNPLNKEDSEYYGIDAAIEKPFVPTQFLRKLTDVLEDNPNFNAAQTETFTTFRDTRILVCEDVDINQEVIASMLAEFGVTTVSAADGSEGIQLLDSGEAIDLVLMDLHMPVMDGYSAAKAIRANNKYDTLPIISLTADAMVESVEMCLEIGFNDVMTKPTSFEDLHRILLKWLPENKRQ